MPYRKVVEVFDLLQDIGISKNVVHRAVSEAGNLIKQKKSTILGLYQKVSNERKKSRPT